MRVSNKDDIIVSIKICMELPGWRTVGDIRVSGQVGLLDGSLPRDCLLRLCLDNNTP